jgi:hypothetical protein
VTRRKVLDVLLVAWVVIWIVLGITVARAVHRLADITDAERQAGIATQQAGDLLGSLADVPLVGGQIRDGAAQVKQSGRDVVASAERAKERTRRTGTILGVVIAIVPSAPLLLLYLPGRLAFERDRRRISATLRGDPAAADELLATRAIAHLPYGRLLKITGDPLEDLRAGRHTALADAELARLGLSAPRSARGR